MSRAYCPHTLFRTVRTELWQALFERKEFIVIKNKNTLDEVYVLPQVYLTYKKRLRKSRQIRRASVTFQQSAKTLLAADVGEFEGFDVGTIALGLRPTSFSLHPRNPVFDALMRPVLVVIVDVGLAQYRKMLEPEDDEVMQALVLDALNHPFGEGVGVWRARRAFEDLHAFTLQFGVECVAELAVSISLHVSDLQALFPRLCDKLVGLLSGPCLGRVKGRLRNDHSPRFDVQKHEHKRIPHPLPGQHFAAKEVALPKRCRMLFEKLVPCSLAALRARVETVLFQDVAEGTPLRPGLRTYAKRPQVHCPDRDEPRRRRARNQP
jgi:hypothetical protein